MSVFGGDYAKYYDLFYADKDYVAEAAFVRDIIRRRAPSARNILELGCGSGGHALPLIRDGYAVTGVDRSAEMLTRAADKVKHLPPELRDRILLKQSDAVQFESAQVYDAVISLFHVVSYQTTNATLLGIFRSARSALSPGSLFIFDFWYGPAVLENRPQVRVRRVETPDVYVTRIAEPKHDSARNVVEVKYTLLARDKKSGLAEEAREVHAMRYMFLPEVEMLADRVGLEVVETGEWLTGRPLDDGCWSGYAVASPSRRLAWSDQEVS